MKLRKNIKSLVLTITNNSPEEFELYGKKSSLMISHSRLWGLIFTLWFTRGEAILLRYWWTDFQFASNSEQTLGTAITSSLLEKFAYNIYEAWNQKRKIRTRGRTYKIATLMNSGIKEAQGCQTHPSKKAMRNLSWEKKLIAPKTLPHFSCILFGKDKASKRKRYSTPFSKELECSSTGISSAGQPDTLTIWGCADNTDNRPEMAIRTPAAGPRYRNSFTAQRVSFFQKQMERKL